MSSVVEIGHQLNALQQKLISELEASRADRQEISVKLLSVRDELIMDLDRFRQHVNDIFEAALAELNKSSKEREASLVKVLNGDVVAKAS